MYRWVKENFEKDEGLKSPGSRAGHAMVSVGDCFYCFSGDDDPKNDFWKYDVIRESWFPLANGPNGRIASTIVHHNGYLYMFGGWMGNYVVGDTWRYEIKSDSWVELIVDDDKEPPARSNHSVGVVNGEMLIFGGLDYQNLLGDVWLLNLTSHKWRDCVSDNLNDQRPVPSRCHASFVHNGEFYIFGGGCEQFALKEVWKFSVPSKKWTMIDDSHSLFQPAPILFCSGVYIDGMFYVFGGRFKKEKQNNLWQFDLEKRVWESLSIENGPPKVSGHQGSLVNKQFCIFGGADMTDRRCDIWKLDVGNFIACKRFAKKNRGDYSDVNIICEVERRH